jgi:hypothetical protein
MSDIAIYRQLHNISSLNEAFEKGDDRLPNLRFGVSGHLCDVDIVVKRA